MLHPRLYRPLCPVFVALVCACQPVKKPDQTTAGVIETEEPERSVLVHTLPEGHETLVFPPPVDGRAKRPILSMPDGSEHKTKDDVKKPEGPLEVRWPSSNSFRFSGQSFHITFNKPIFEQVKRPKRVAKGTFKITPKVKGKARWTSRSVLEFEADEPFDPDTQYTVEVSGLTAHEGPAMEEPWTATFTASPRIPMAGKVLTYIPRPGYPRVISMFPPTGAKVGERQSIGVIYDQPIDLERAAKLVTLKSGNKKRPVKLTHPLGSKFQGIEIDSKHVVVVIPETPLKPLEELALIAADRIHKDDLDGDEKPDPSVHDFTIAGPLELTEVACGYGYNSTCEWKENQRELKTGGRDIEIKFSNPLRGTTKELKNGVHIYPAVKNLSVWSSGGWDGVGRLRISGAFESSTRYNVSISGVEDVHGHRVNTPIEFAIQTNPEGASATMAEGVLLLDQSASQKFVATTRNVSRAKILAWPIADDDPSAMEKARENVRRHRLPTESAPIEIPFSPQSIQDEYVKTEVNLLSKLKPGSNYITSVAIDKTAHGALVVNYPSWMSAGRTPVALLTPGDSQALAVHTHMMGDSTVVHVSRLESGEPVSGASFKLNGESLLGNPETDQNGVAVLPAGIDRFEDALLHVDGGGASTTISMEGSRTRARSMYPGMTTGEVLPGGDARGLVMTDRGIYRPGATVHVKASLRRKVGERLAPMASTPVQVRIIGPTGDEVASYPGVTDEFGSVAIDHPTEKEARVGRHQIEVNTLTDTDTVLARESVMVAEFEPPRFTVDVEAKASGNKSLAATVLGRYLFGAPMEGASVEWSISRREAKLARSTLTDAGLQFTDGRYTYYYDDDDESSSRWSRSGRGTLDADGTLELAPTVQLDKKGGPQEFTVEADVTDASYRHIAGRGSAVLHPADKYAGLRLKTAWTDVEKPMAVDLGVVGTDGQPISGVKVTAKLVHIDWKYTRKRTSYGIEYDWHRVRKDVDSCSVTSAVTPVSCEVTPPDSGRYELISTVGGREGGAVTTWAWRRGGSSSRFPTQGHRIDLVSDKPRYAPGDRAQILVRNPYPAATAILTLEQGGLVTHRSIKIDGGAEVLEVPITKSHAPRIHATVTLIPRNVTGADRADWKVGVLRLPVSLEDAELNVAVKTDRDQYQPGQQVTLDVDVKNGSTSVSGAEVAVAVVDEGILRMTNHHAPDPVKGLRPGQPLNFEILDSREGLAALMRLSKDSGDGDAGEENQDSSRKNFVQTAFWKPDLRTDANGRARVTFTLPDNLTKFRVMAVVLDKDGRGGSQEHAFTVRKPVMMIPIIPRFAHVGDQFEAAAMLHNNTDEPLDAKVTLGPREQAIEVKPNKRARVNFPLTADKPGDLALAFAVKQGGKTHDAVEVSLPVDRAGIAEHPRLDGAFVQGQDILMKVPDGVFAGRGQQEVVKVLVGQHLWPELGARLEFLLGYPHGCVEQTTSSTLPLLAARDILPRIGLTSMPQEELDKRIKAGIDRLASMRTSSGGLAYWPGGSSPNVYGTAYAIRAVIAAKKADIDLPPNLLSGMTDYLGEQMLRSRTAPEVKAAIAQSLAEVDELPQSSADALYDTFESQGVFGLASLAIALSHLDGQEDRVKTIVDALESKFDNEGSLLDTSKSDDFYYYGSPTRTKAQALVAIGRLRKASTLRPVLTKVLAESTGSYTTQSTAYSLMAVAEQLVDSPTDGAKIEVYLGSEQLTPSKELGHGSFEFTIPLERLRGKEETLKLRSEAKAAIAFMVDSTWSRDLQDARGQAATSAEKGVNLYRVITDGAGNEIKLEEVEPGQVLRVALLAELPVDKIDRDRMGYLAITDRLPAGFEPMQTDLWTVARAPDLTDAHPFSQWLRWGGTEASYIEMRDDRVYIYFDRLWGRRALATYLVRATTPGTYALPPAVGEFMYVPNSYSYSAAGTVKVVK